MQRRQGLAMRAAAMAAALVAVVCGGAGGASAVAVEMSVVAASTGLPLCAGPVQNGVETCSTTGIAGQQIIVTWSLTEATVINGYDFNVEWDPTELTLVSSSQLFPGSQAPNTIPFLIAPSPADPEGSAAVVLSLVPFETTPLFQATFQLIYPPPPIVCGVHADIAWSANGNGLAPVGVVLDNPSGAGVDVTLPAQCRDGLDNDNDSAIDFDGGICAGLPPEAVTTPDRHCTGPTDNRERAGCGIGAELVLVLPLLGAGARRRRTR